MHVVVAVGAIQPPFRYPKLIQGVYWLIIVQSGSFIPGTIARHIRSYYMLMGVCMVVNFSTALLLKIRSTQKHGEKAERCVFVWTVSRRAGCISCRFKVNPPGSPSVIFFSKGSSSQANRTKSKKPIFTMIFTQKLKTNELKS